MPKTRKQQQREQAERRERRERRIDQLIEMHQPPPKIRAADGKEYRPGDPQFGALLAQFTMTKAWSTPMQSTAAPRPRPK